MTLLALDIGGTNCRMALFSEEEAGGMQPVARRDVPSEGLVTAGDLCRALQAAFGERLALARAAGIAMAGPVFGDRASLSNGSLALTGRETGTLLGMPVFLCNDFTAVSHAVASRAGREALLVQGTPGTGVQAVLGAGTGLGCAAIVPSPAGPVHLASEAGHMACAFQGEEERAFEAFLLARTGLAFASVEDVLSGRGLKAMAAFVTGREHTGREAGALLRDMEHPLSGLYSRFYARAARNWALATLCRGGLWIAGGIAMGNPQVLCSPVFREEFVRGRHADFLQDVPVHLFRDEAYGLWGAARMAQAQAG